MQRRIRVGVMGLGWVACHRHLPALRRNPAFDLVGLIDRKAGHAQRIAREHKIPRFAETETVRDIPWLDEIDALVIGAPPMAHADLVTTALNAGKHVLTEKPFAMDVIEGETMVDTARRTGKTLAIVHNFQFSRAAQRLEKDIASGRLGKIRRIAAYQLGNPRRRLPVWYETLPLGLFYDESPHFFYLLNRLSGGELMLRHGHAVAGQNGENTPSLLNLLYRGAGGIPVTVDCQFDSALSEWGIRVTGENGTGIIDIFRDIYLFLPNDGAHCALSIVRTSFAAITQHAMQHIPNGLSLIAGRLAYGNDEVFGRFAQAIQTGEPPQDIGAEAALTVLKLQHEAIDEIRKNLFP